MCCAENRPQRAPEEPGAIVARHHDRDERRRAFLKIIVRRCEALEARAELLQARSRIFLMLRRLCSEGRMQVSTSTSPSFVTAATTILVTGQVLCLFNRELMISAQSLAVDSPRLVPIVHADDCGLSEGTTDAIVACHDRGWLRRTSVIVNGAGWEHAVADAQRSCLAGGRPAPESVRGRPAVIPGRRGSARRPSRAVSVEGSPRSGRKAWRALTRSRLRAQIRLELRRQIERFLEAFADRGPLSSTVTCTTTCCRPCSMSCWRLCDEYPIAAIRLPREPLYWPLTRERRGRLLNVVKNVVLRALCRRARPALHARSMQTTEAFVGVLGTGAMTLAHVRAALNTCVVPEPSEPSRSCFIPGAPVRTRRRSGATGPSCGSSISRRTATVRPSSCAVPLSVNCCAPTACRLTPGCPIAAAARGLTDECARRVRRDRRRSSGRLPVARRTAGGVCRRGAVRPRQAGERVVSGAVDGVVPARRGALAGGCRRTRVRLGRERQLGSHAAVDGAVVRRQSPDADAGSKPPVAAPGRPAMGSAALAGLQTLLHLHPWNLQERLILALRDGGFVRDPIPAAALLPAPPLSRRDGLLLLRAERGGGARLRRARRGAHGVDLSRRRTLAARGASHRTAALARLVLLGQHRIPWLGRQRRRSQADGPGAIRRPRSDAARLRRRVSPAHTDGVRIDPDCIFYGRRSYGRFFGDKMVERLGPPRAPDEELTQRHRDIAFAVQQRLEEAALHLARLALRETGSRNLCVAGGVALNCKMTGALHRAGMADRLFVQPLSYDAGVALGAAMLAAEQAGDDCRFRNGAPAVRSRLRRCGDRGGAAAATACAIAAATTSPTTPPRSWRTGRWSAGFRAGWKLARARSVAARSSPIRAPRR